MSIQEKLKELEEQAAKLRTERVEELKKILAETQAELEELGESPKPRKKQAKREKDPNKPCGVCQFPTSPPHDGRLKAHREQEEKKPFTNGELKKLGMVKVAEATSDAQN